MMGRTQFVGLVLLLSTVATLGGCNFVDGFFAYVELGSQLKQTAEAPPARLEIVQGMPVAHLYGTPTERGEQYGRLLRGPLRNLSRCLHGFLSEPYRAHALENAKVQEPLLSEDLRAEMKALAAAAGVDYMEIVAINVTPRLACSALAVWDPAAAAKGEDAGMIMGRNADYFSLGFKDRGMLVTVHHAAGAHAVASVNFLGMIGAFTGINDSGVAFGNMLVFNASGPQKQDGGLTIQLALREAALHADSAREMAMMLAGTKHAIPMNVMVADRTEAIVLELGLENLAVRRGNGVLVATNHFREPGMAAYDRPCERYETLMEHGKKHAPSMTLDEMKQAVDAAKIGPMNLQAVIFEPAKMKMHVSINKAPAAAGPYVELDSKELFAVPPTPPATSQPATNATAERLH